MARFNIFSIGLLLTVALNFVDCSNDEVKSNIEVVTVPSLAKYLLENPGAKIQPMTKDSNKFGVSPDKQMTYKIGQRVNGDRLLATDSRSQKYSGPKNIKTNLRYPQSGDGTGTVITCLEVSVDQSSSLGQAVVVSGGIGQSHIAVVIEARQTLYFSYRAAIYGWAF